jgi:hypothetical protein
LLIRIDHLRAHTLNGDHHRRNILRTRTIGSSKNVIMNGTDAGVTRPAMPLLFVDDVTSTSITIGWWLDPEWVSKLQKRMESVHRVMESTVVDSCIPLLSFKPVSLPSPCSSLF